MQHRARDGPQWNQQLAKTTEHTKNLNKIASLNSENAYLAVMAKNKYNRPFSEQCTKGKN
jgi:hypothetical protein